MHGSTKHWFFGHGRIWFLIFSSSCSFFVAQVPVYVLLYITCVLKWIWILEWAASDHEWVKSYRAVCNISSCPCAHVKSLMRQLLHTLHYDKLWNYSIYQTIWSHYYNSTVVWEAWRTGLSRGMCAVHIAEREVAPFTDANKRANVVFINSKGLWRSIT